VRKPKQRQLKLQEDRHVQRTWCWNIWWN
jgi:hypothetical protein